MPILTSQEAMFWFLDSLKPNYISLGTSIEAPRPKSCNASSRRTWINTSNHRPVISTEKMIEIASLNTTYSMISPAMHQWNLVCLMGSSLGSVTTVASRDIKGQSVGVAVKHHAPTDACLTSRPCKAEQIVKREIKKLVFINIKCHKLFIKRFS